MKLYLDIEVNNKKKKNCFYLSKRAPWQTVKNEKNKVNLICFKIIVPNNLVP